VTLILDYDNHILYTENRRRWTYSRTSI